VLKAWRRDRCRARRGAPRPSWRWVQVLLGTGTPASGGAWAGRKGERVEHENFVVDADTSSAEGRAVAWARSLPISQFRWPLGRVDVALQGS